MAVANIMPAARGLRMGVGFGCLQRIAVVGIAWQLSVRRGTASEDSSCSNDTKGRLGLQRTAAGCSASLGDSGAIHRRKTARTTTCFAGMMAATVCAGGATRCCRPAVVALVSDGNLEAGHHNSSSWQRLCRRICDSEC